MSKQRVRKLAMTIALVAAVTGGVSATHAEDDARRSTIDSATGIRLFENVAAQPDAGFATSTRILRRVDRRSIESLLRSPIDPGSRRSMLIDVPGGPSLDVDVRDVRVTESHAEIRGRVVGQPGSAVNLALVGDALAGEIFVGAELGSYVLRPSGGVVVVERSVDHDHGCGCIESPESRVASDDVASSDLPPASQLAEIDMLVLYADEAMGSRSDAEMEAIVRSTIDATNQVYINSDVPIRLRLVHVAQADFPHYVGLDSYLRTVTNYDGVADEAFELRNEYGADLVCVVGTYDESRCGTAWLGGEQSAVAIGCMDGFTFAHEVGHNLGLDHDRENARYDVPSQFNYGHRFVGADDGRTYRTVMSYAPGVRIPYHSNPGVAYSGTPTGVGEGEPGAADAVRHIIENAQRAVNRRATKVFAAETAADEYVVSEDVELHVPVGAGVLANDFDSVNAGLDLIARLGSEPEHGAVTLESDGSLLYVPDPDFNGVDEFSYVADNGIIDSLPERVRVSVTPVEDAPRFDGPLVFDPPVPAVGDPVRLSVNVFDPDGDPLDVVWERDGVALGSVASFEHVFGTAGPVALRVTAADGKHTSEISDVLNVGESLRVSKLKLKFHYHRGGKDSVTLSCGFRASRPPARGDHFRVDIDGLVLEGELGRGTRWRDGGRRVQFKRLRGKRWSVVVKMRKETVRDHFLADGTVRDARGLPAPATWRMPVSISVGEQHAATTAEIDFRSKSSSVGLAN